MDEVSTTLAVYFVFPGLRAKAEKAKVQQFKKIESADP